MITLKLEFNYIFKKLIKYNECCCFFLGQFSAVFRSLLYEACGRLVNPTYGSLGLFWAGEWVRCEAAVDAVLTGCKISDVAASDWQASGTLGGGDHLLPSYDIRHVARGANMDDTRDKNWFKRTEPAIKPNPQVGSVDSAALWKCGWESESVETVEASWVSQDEPDKANETGLNLELTLGFRC